VTERDDNQEEGGGGRPGFPIEPMRLWQALRARWIVVFVVSVVAAFAGAGYAKKVVKQSFEATAVLAWEASAPIDLVTRQTTLESVGLNSNLAIVRTEMGLTMPVRDLGNFFVVTSSPNSNIIKIKAIWASAEGAATMANSLTRAFLDNRGKVAADRLQAKTRRSGAAVQEAERRSIAAADAYEKFRHEKGFLDISQERELAIAATAEKAAAAEDARRRAEAARSELEALAHEQESEPALSDAEREQAKLDLEQLPGLRSQLASARVEFAEDHPTVLRLRKLLEALEARIKNRGDLSGKGGSESARRAALEKKRTEAEAERKQAEDAAAVLQEKLDKLSEAEGQAALLLGEIAVAKKSLESAKQLLNESELSAEDPPDEFRILEEATPPDVAMSSPRKKVAIMFPAVAFCLSLLAVLLWGLRRAEVITPKEAAFWAGAPVIGASTWPREPHMLASLMHDLDDFAARCDGVTLTLGFSSEEAPLAQRIVTWEGQRAPRREQPRLLASGDDEGSLALRDAEAEAPNDLQMILTLTGSVPAQTLRRAARTADRVMVVVHSGSHGCFELARIKNQLGRDDGVGILLVGLPTEYATARDRIGEVRQFWQATREA
jgi:uncharacterized protein involved in exopolysaccharide biosynthesis